MTEISRTVLILLSGQVVIAFVLVWFLPITHAAESKTSFIDLSLGRVKGKLGISSNGFNYVSYLGVPYAFPPIGPRRFARPEPLTPGALWNGTFDGSQPPPSCLQVDQKGTDVRGQEDCLVINIYKPVRCCQSACAVMVWIHGGGFLMNDGTPTSFGPDYFMDFDVILVSVQYRLGVLGFFTLESDDAPGNLGLRDQALALEFIKSEAKNFCGDEDRITIFGAGAGSKSAILQMISPLNQGKKLFSGLISQSGSPVKDPSLIFSKVGKKRMQAILLAKTLGCAKLDTLSDEKILNCLRTKVSGSNLQKSGVKLFTEIFSTEDQTGDHLFLLNPWRPFVDGQLDIQDPFLPNLPEDIIRSGDYHHVPVLIGDTSENGMLMMAPFIQHPLLYSNFTEMLPKLLLKKNTKEVTYKETQIIETIKRHYLPGGEIERLNVKHAIGMMTDFAYHGPVGTTVKLLSSSPSSPPVYHYMYKYSATHSIADVSVCPNWKIAVKTWLHGFGLGYNIRNSYGISHNDELLMMFKMDKLKWPTKVGIVTDRDKKTSENILNLWTNFAKFQNPTPKKGNQSSPLKGFTWEQTSSSKSRIAFMTSDLRMGQYPLFWSQVSFYQRIIEALKADSKVLERHEILDLLKIEELDEDQDSISNQNKSDL